MNTVEPKTDLNFRRAVRANFLGRRIYAGRGRTDYARRITHSTPVVVVPESSAAPEVKGSGYWKTTFRNGPNFARTLYTPSTLRIEVGADWKPAAFAPTEVQG